ncbi:MAG: putative Holliday junction resolvase [Planctomycetota bacterium]|jgi:putative Holliday junction resolvase
MSQERNQPENNEPEKEHSGSSSPPSIENGEETATEGSPAFVETPQESLDPIPKLGRLAAIDYGTVRMGIAVCDPSQTWVTPYETWGRQPQREQAYFQELVRRESLVGIIVGLPLHNDGRESQKSQEARSFVHRLQKSLQLPVILFDERFSTSHAQRLLAETGLSKAKKKAKLDQIAAHVILESYLESSRQQGSPPQSLDDFQQKPKQ